MVTFYLNTDHVISVTGLQDSDGNAITGATVTATILDANDAEVGGATWPITLTGDGAGNYEGTLPYDAEITYGNTYYLKLVADGSGKHREWKDELRLKKGDIG